ncbi:leucyl/phenylalanyl-tRNA--protein transferase [Acidiferrimicrobium sp. IK]|uniref:leucyl/phenylalanyl-tRNA--protein transferase n=1 Tax=Acidiferrimicrobium sp. IK TaxID=2871700 RepID=UPI0021CB8449|nr:leucyl/phenylalanyl-tRNA--protein transferase [Acidiferrimicrobium sp. IK]MCU4186163.1 leucyl/phenylalanyl-tRNA--protein transferase [Acidiferrimicrobium sp. IK]
MAEHRRPPRHPVEPPPSRWAFPQGAQAIDAAAGTSEVIGVGADLEPGTVLAAYRAGLFPMPARRGLMAWWSPDPRGVIPLDGLRISRSLRKSCARMEVRVDTAFGEVIDACADRRRPGAWIDRRIKAAYLELHRLGWVHSVEAWRDDDLVGGLYGVAIGGLFAGESMFHRASDASKVALVGLVERLAAGGAVLLDVQWATDHLRSVGAVEVPRARYHELLAEALAAPAQVEW